MAIETRTVRIVVEAVPNGGGPSHYRLVAYGKGPLLQQPEFSSAIELFNAFAAAGIRMKDADLLDNQADDDVVYAEDRALSKKQLHILGLLPA